MERDAIQEIEQLTLKANSTETVKTEQRGVYFLREADGTLTKHRAELDPVGATLHTVEDFLQALADDSNVHAVFVNDQGASAVANDGFTRWSYNLPLPVHPVFKLLEFLTGRENPLRQKEIVRLLRTQLSGFVPESVIENLRLVKTNSSSNSEALTAQGNKHVDLSIRRAATLRDGNAIPEKFIWDVPVFDLLELLPFLQPVTVLLDVEPAERADDTEFTLTPLHDDLRKARMAVLDELVKQIKTHAKLPSHINVLRGTHAN